MQLFPVWHYVHKTLMSLTFEILFMQVFGIVKTPLTCLCLVWFVCKVKTDGKSQGPRIPKLENHPKCHKAVHFPLKLIILTDSTDRFSKLNFFIDILKPGLKNILNRK